MAFKLTLLVHQAALVLGQGGTQEAAAAAAMTTVRTIGNWLERPEFRELVDEIEADIVTAVKEKEIGLAVKDREARLLNRQRRANLLAEIISRKAEDEGGDVADMVRLLKEERENEKQAAIEVGDWTEKREIDYTKLSTEQLLQLLGANASTGD